MWTPSLVTAPSVEPVTVSEALAHMRVDSDVEHDLVEALIVAARSHVETYTRRALLSQTWDLNADGFPVWDTIELPYAPLASVTSVKYYSSDTQSTLASSSYIVDAPAGDHAPRGRIVLVDGQTWPTTDTRVNAVTVRFVAGYGSTSADVPRPIRQAVLLLVAEMFERRAQVTIGATQSPNVITAERLLAPFRSLRW